MCVATARMKTCLTSDFDFDLPSESIAHTPAPTRRQSRLLYLDANGRHADTRFCALPSLLRKNDLLVINDSKVIKARLRARKPSGGRAEIMLERMLGPRRALARLNAGKPPRDDAALFIGDDWELRVIDRREEFFTLESMSGDFDTLLQEHGEVPLPPYIKRPAQASDEARYQTVYAKHPGSVAAPTAGLHFDEALLRQLGAAGAEIASLTLHIGSGTYQPLRSDTLQAHRMHEELFETDRALCEAIDTCRQRRGRVVAVGTTTVRVLEALAASGGVRPVRQSTDIFITPGFKFRAVDMMITNFHLPRTTLFVLVCAFGGRERMLAAYRHAIAQSYRFFSYGDAMLIEKNDAV